MRHWRYSILLLFAVVAIGIVGATLLIGARIRHDAKTSLRRSLDRDGSSLARLEAQHRDAIPTDGRSFDPETLRQARRIEAALWVEYPKLPSSLRTSGHGAAVAVSRATSEVGALQLWLAYERLHAEKDGRPFDLGAVRMGYERLTRRSNHNLPPFDELVRDEATRSAARDVERLRTKLGS